MKVKYLKLETIHIINPAQLLKELETFDVDPNRVSINPYCAIIEDCDISAERKPGSSTEGLASTQSGVGSALSRKILRSARLAKDVQELSSMIRKLDIHYYLDQGCTALMEVPQGTDLSIDGGFYPYTTSRNITPAAAMSDCQVHPSYLGNVCLIFRTYPIRVGNITRDGVEVGNRPVWDDSDELSWDNLGLNAEITTVTMRKRRVFSFSMKQYKNSLNIWRPDYILLNFANYLSKEKLSLLLEQLPEVTHLGFGPRSEDVFLNHSYFGDCY